VFQDSKPCAMKKIP